MLLFTGLSGCLVFAFLVVTNTNNTAATLNERNAHSVDNAGDGFLIDDAGAADTLSLYRSFTQSRRLGAKGYDKVPTSSNSPLETDVTFLSMSSSSPTISISKTYRRSITRGAHWQAKWRQQLDAVLNDNVDDALGANNTGPGDIHINGSDDSRRTAPDNDEGEDLVLANNNIVTALDPEPQLTVASPHSPLKGNLLFNFVLLAFERRKSAMSV